jgi:hypothetical protein
LGTAERTLQPVPLFVAHHHHLPRECPASVGGSELLSLISAAHAARHGVTIEAEAIIDTEHRLILILDAPNGEAVHQFLDFLRPLGVLQILAASTAEEAVQRGSCEPEHEPVRPEGAE